ncbi:MAG: AMP-binding protein [Anaerolineales bacterium]|nr:AMP-binding protein [Anaerolineales bacterium]
MSSIYLTDRSSLFERLYSIAPVWLQNVGISVYGILWRQQRFGGNFPKLVAQFQERERFSFNEWREYQTRQLQALLQHANRTIRYYRELFNSLGLQSRSLEYFTPEDLPNLPLLEKETIRSNPDKFLNQEVDRRRLLIDYTSGTTGTPLPVLRSTLTNRATSAAYEARIRRWAGVNYRMSRAMIGGRIVIPPTRAKPPFWRYNLAERQLYLSAFHISPANTSNYVAALNFFRPKYLVGYASAHYFLARNAEEQGLQLYRPQAILTSSDKLTPEMRQLLQRVYGCQVFDGYSGVENCCLASECEHHRMHLSPDVGIVELVDSDGRPTPPGEMGEIVATGLLNFDQPLIRYRTGDYAILSPEPCPCGRQMPVLEELVGRLEDIVIGQDGREVIRFQGIFLGLPNVREAQIIQKTLTYFQVRLVVNAGFSEDEKRILYQRFVERLGPINLEFQLVDQIERTERGKFRAVVSHVPRAQRTSCT